jgi:hypothetical protein
MWLPARGYVPTEASSGMVQVIHEPSIMAREENMHARFRL